MGLFEYLFLPGSFLPSLGGEEPGLLQFCLPPLSITKKGLPLYLEFGTRLPLLIDMLAASLRSFGYPLFLCLGSVQFGRKFAGFPFPSQYRIALATTVVTAGYSTARANYFSIQRNNRWQADIPVHAVRLPATIPRRS